MLTEIRVYENEKENLVDIVIKDSSADCLYREMIKILAECSREQAITINCIAQTGLICLSNVENRDKLLRAIDSYIKAEYSLEDIKASFLHGRVFFYEIY